VGHRLSVRVTATPADGPSGTATSAATRAVARAGSIVRLRLSDTTPRAGQRLTLRMSVAASPSTVTATGTVVVRVDGRRVAAATVRAGTATVVLRLRKGVHTIAAAYGGSPSVVGDAAVVRVRVRG
jgi:hypothetical protein